MHTMGLHPKDGGKWEITARLEKKTKDGVSVVKNAAFYRDFP